MDTYGKQVYDDKGKGKKEEKKYRCNYCSFEFAEYVRRIETESGGISTQVRCPRCMNFLKT